MKKDEYDYYGIGNMKKLSTDIALLIRGFKNGLLMINNRPLVEQLNLFISDIEKRNKTINEGLKKLDNKPKIT